MDPGIKVGMALRSELSSLPSPFSGLFTRTGGLLRQINTVNSIHILDGDLLYKIGESNCTL